MTIYIHVCTNINVSVYTFSIFSMKCSEKHYFKHKLFRDGPFDIQGGGAEIFFKKVVCFNQANSCQLSTQFRRVLTTKK